MSAFHNERRFGSKDDLSLVQDVKRPVGLSTDSASSTRSYGKVRSAALLILSIYYLFRLPAYLNPADASAVSEVIFDVAEPACPQASSIQPSRHEKLFSELDTLYAKDHFKQFAYTSLGLAVRVP